MAFSQQKQKRIDLRNPANTRYYVIDGLGHVRALVAPNGAITEVWHYDSWGNILSMPTQRIEQPFLWNGAYGYEYIPFTGLYHIGAREYDPRTTLLGFMVHSPTLCGN